ncbi:MAG: DUF433 domain-containing protein [Woeseia sp.]
MTTYSNSSTDGLREQPAYGLAEASRYLKLPAATLRTWLVGREYPKGKGTEHWKPLIQPAQKDPVLLSFWNLVEAHVLRALRTEHGTSIKALRDALEFAERKLRIERLLLHRDLKTAAGRLFLDRYGQLIELSASGQLAMRKMFEEHLDRVEWDEWSFPIRLYPFVAGQGRSKPIAIDPKIAFGRPIVLRTGISTAAIVQRLDAGESPADLADDYELNESEIEEAVLYERAA